MLFSPRAGGQPSEIRLCAGSCSLGSLQEAGGGSLPWVCQLRTAAVLAAPWCVPHLSVSTGVPTSPPGACLHILLSSCADTSPLWPPPSCDDLVPADDTCEDPISTPAPGLRFWGTWILEEALEPSPPSVWRAVLSPASFPEPGPQLCPECLCHPLLRVTCSVCFRPRFGLISLSKWAHLGCAKGRMARAAYGEEADVIPPGLVGHLPLSAPFFPCSLASRSGDDPRPPAAQG